MTQYQKRQSVGGAWLKASELKSGTKVKLISEVSPSQSEYGPQDVGKLRVHGMEEPVNVRLNKATLNGLIDAFGEDSKDWMGNVLTAVTEKALVSGKRVTILYLIPEGFEMREDSGGYITIVRAEAAPEATARPTHSGS